VNEQKTSGTHTINFNAGNLASEIYFYRIEAKHFPELRILILLKK